MQNVAEIGSPAPNFDLPRDGRTVVHAKANEALGRTVIGQFIAGFMAGATRGAPRLLEAPGQRIEMTISGPAAAQDLDGYIDAVRGWGHDVWEAWSIHHDLVHTWIREIRSTR